MYLAFFGPSILAAAGSLAGVAPPDEAGWWITAPTGLQQLSQAVLAVTVALLLAGRRGRRPIDIGLAATRAQGGPGGRQGVRMAAWAATGLVVGSLVTAALATGHYPFGSTSGANTVLDLSAAVNAGVTEEVVVLAFLVTTLEQARRPRAEIAAVALICRGAYHIYYGGGALGILVWAGVFLWLFWRFRSVVPMIVVHICWDSLVFLERVSKAFGGLLVLGLLGLVVVSVVLWLADRAERSRLGTGPPAGYPPASANPPYPPGTAGPAPGPPSPGYGGWGAPPGATP